MEENEDNEVLPHTLEIVHPVTIASCAIQQLPKLLYAMSNMARRSRRQFHRRGIILGGHYWEEKGIPVTLHQTGSIDISIPEEEIPKLKGILKKHSEPSLDQLSAYNEFWKTYSFSSLTDGNSASCSSFHHFQGPISCRSYLRRTTHQAAHRSHETDNCKPLQIFIGQLCRKDLQEGLYRSQTKIFLESFPLPLTTTQYLQNIMFRHLKYCELDEEEQEILSQLQYLKVLFNTPLHKLVRERPKEYLLPLPGRRQSRNQSAGAPKPAYARSLTNYQTVQTLPSPKQTFKWLSFTNLDFSRSPIFGFGNNDTIEGMSYYTKRLATTVPKGVAFITYPDSVDETSFEGTIGGRSVISWEKGTKFPQMGIDQSSEFKYKKEMGKQQMIQSRLRAARFYRRIHCDNWNNYVNGNKQGVVRRSCAYTPKKGYRINKGSQRNANEGVGSASPTHSLFKSWFKLAHLKRSLRLINESLQNTTGNNMSTDLLSEGINSVNNDPLTASARRAVIVAERKKRIKLYLMTIAKYLSCGLIPYFMKGECRLFKRRQMRTVDSTERCSVPPLPATREVEPIA